MNCGQQSRQQTDNTDKDKMEAIMKNLGVCLDMGEDGEWTAFGDWDEERKKDFISDILGGGKKDRATIMTNIGKVAKVKEVGESGFVVKKPEDWSTWSEQKQNEFADFIIGEAGEGASFEAVRTCCLCDKEYTGYGNNPAPVAEEGRCCDECNTTQVVPARLAYVEREIKAKKWLQKLLGDMFQLSYERDGAHMDRCATKIGWGAGLRLGSTAEPDWFKDIKGEHEMSLKPQPGGNDGWTISRRVNSVSLAIATYLIMGHAQKTFKFGGKTGDWGVNPDSTWYCEPTIAFPLEDGTVRSATFHITPVEEDNHPKIQHGRYIDFIVWKITDHKECKAVKLDFAWADILNARTERDEEAKAKAERKRLEKEKRKRAEEKEAKKQADKQALRRAYHEKCLEEIAIMERKEEERKARDEEETRKREADFEARLKALEVKEAERKEEEKREKEEKARKAEQKRAETLKKQEEKQAKWKK